ncbi:MAG: hypothetical protein WD010_08620 [Nitriliruptor sp.]|uniref:hypothetical protein n=1 Tax=Nitriliruptor sp. TaxID=2448056 RepID=UPI00349FE9A0
MVQDGSTTEALDAPGGPDAPAPGDDLAPAMGDARRGSMLPWIIAAIATLAAIAAVVWAVLTIQEADARTAELERIETAAGSFALELTTWDASDGMADTRESLRAAGTETFATDVDQLFGGTDDLATLEEIGARSRGEVEDVLVQSLDGDQAVALAVVVQEVTTDITEGTEVSLRYARLGLVDDGGEWRIDSVELVVDALQETADRTDVVPPSDAGATVDGEDEG